MTKNISKEENNMHRSISKIFESLVSFKISFLKEVDILIAAYLYFDKNLLNFVGFYSFIVQVKHFIKYFTISTFNFDKNSLISRSQILFLFLLTFVFLLRRWSTVLSNCRLLAKIAKIFSKNWQSSFEGLYFCKLFNFWPTDLFCDTITLILT